MKQVVTLFAIIAGLSAMTSTEASAQRSGSLQATAQVVDTRESWTDLKSARSMAASWQITSAAISQTNLAQVSMVVLPAWSPAEESPKAEITINYIRN